jgi:hypothetical protein
MSALPDAKLNALETLTGATGHVNDLEYAYLILLGAMPADIYGMWGQVFDAAAIPAGQFNDRWYAYMDFILAPATEDGYNDREREYWDGGGTPIGPVFPSPPAVANLSHWWNATLAAKVWADAAGTIPATPGGLMERQDDDGLNSLFLSEVGLGVPTWSTVANGVNGLQVVSGNVGQGYFPSAVASGGWATGLSFATIQKITFTGTTHATFAYDSAKINLQAVINPVLGWRVNIPGIGFTNFNKLVVIGEWVWMYFGIDAAGNWRARCAGAVEVTGAGVYAPMSGGGTISFSGSPVDSPETFMWNRALTPAEWAAFIAYADSRYGVMPF